MKSKMKRRMLAIVLCMVIVLSNSSFIFASSESGTPAVEAAGTEGTTSQTETDTQVTETTPQTLAVSESTPAPTDEPAAPTSVDATPTPTDTPEVTTTPEPTGTPTPEATPTPTDTPETTTIPEPTDAPEITTTPEPTDAPETTTTSEPTDTPEATPTPTQGPENGTSDTAQPTATPTPTEAPVKSNEAVELKQEFKDSDGNVTSTVKAQIPEGTFAADASEITMEVQTPDTASAEHVKEMMEENLPENYMLGDYILYDIQFKVNGTVTEPQKPITITFEGEELSVKDVKRANVFWLDPEDPQVDGDKDQLVEITQKSEMIENLQNSGQSTENIDDYDLSEITLKEDGTSDKIQMEGRTSTIYGCYVVYEPVQVLTYDDDQVTVTVSAAEEGIIPANAELKVVPITAEDKNTEDQYKEVEQKLQEKAEEDAYDIAGFLAYDITFVDEDGNETEPGGEVKVSIDYKEAAIPEAISEEDAVNAEVTVLHLEEDEKGEVKEVVDMAQNEKVDVLATTEENKIEKAEVRTESFSTFVIQWQYGDYSSFQIKAHYVYQTANGGTSEFPRGFGNQINIPMADGQEYDLNMYRQPITYNGEAYTCVGIRLNDANGAEIRKLKTSSETTGSGFYESTTYYVRYQEAGEDTYTDWLNSSRSGKQSGNIYFVYEKADLWIEDQIINNGVLKANYNGADAESYQWSRSDTENGTYETVENVDYVDGASKISDDGTELNPAYDDGARKWYKVQVTTTGGKTIESAPFQVEYYSELENGSFENPDYTDENAAMTQTSNENYAAAGGVWQTTGIGTGDKKGDDIEILNAGTLKARTELKNNYAWKTGEDPAAAHGNQFAELNCEATGALYQDVLTIPGATLNYALNHRARGTSSADIEYDTMFLIIMPAKTAVDEGLTTQDKLEDYLWKLHGINADTYYETEGNDIVYDQNGILVVRITSDDQNWNRITQEKPYTSTSTLTRFFFMAGKTAAAESGDKKGKTIGNFLDNVWFSQKIPEPAENEFSIQLTKKIEGIDSQEDRETLINQLSFKVSVKNENSKPLSDTEIEELLGIENAEIKGKDLHLQADGTTLLYTLANKKIDPNKEYTVTITEENADLESGYQRHTTQKTEVTVGDEQESPQESASESSSFQIQSKASVKVTFTNSYEKAENKTVNFTKIWDDAGNTYETRPGSINVTLNASVTINGERKILTEDDLGLEDSAFSKTLSLAEGWKTSWEVPVYYYEGGEKYPIEYGVTEDTEALADHDYVYQASNGGVAQEGTGEEYQPTLSQKDDSLQANANISASMTAINAISAGSNNDSGLGTPNHRKYIKYNPETGDYTLNLTVTGAKGEATGVDILFVIDKSGSMGSNGLLAETQELLTGSWRNPNNGIIDQIFASEGNVNSVAYVAFAGESQTETSGWYTTETKSGLETKIKALKANGGTNWTYAMQEAEDALEKRTDSKNDKVVIFLSDGKPTFTMKYRLGWGWYEDGNGSTYKDSYLQDAADTVNNSSTLRGAKFYSVYLNDDTEDKMVEFSNKISTSTAIDGTDLSSALSDIVANVIPTYKNVEITDLLSEYVEFAEANPTINVTKTRNGQTETLHQGQDFTVDGLESGRVHVSLLGGESLEQFATYTVSFRIKPSEKANQEAASGYPHIGYPDTGSTSAGQPGFYSNADGTKVSYTVNDKEDSADYPKPVIQVTSTTETQNFTVRKEWVGDDEAERPESVQVVLYQSVNEGTAQVYGEPVTLDMGNGWSYTWTDLPSTKKNGTQVVERYTYSVEEINVPEHYASTVSYNSSADATITNTYDENCKDEDFYLVNVLQTDQINISKTWDDHNNSLGKRPESLTVNVSNGTEVRSYTLTGNSETWSTTVTVPRRKGAEYSATEILESSFYKQSTSECVQNGNQVNIRFTNTLNTKSITVEKIWKDGGISDRPDEIGFTLQYWDSDQNTWKDKTTGTISKENGWKTTIEGLESFYKYQVVETPVEGAYRSEVDESTDGFTITNTLTWGAKKTNSNGDTPLGGATFDLKKSDGTVIARGSSGEDGMITWTPEQGITADELQKLNGTYTICETSAPSGYYKSDGEWNVEFDKGLLTKLDGAEVKGTAQDGVIITLKNDIVYDLPSAGGPGIFWYLMGGTMLMMAGSFILYRMKRREVLGS